MAILDIVKPSVRAVRLIPSVHAGLRQQLKLPAHVHSLGLLTSDSDDVAYIAADEATKHAQVEVYLGNSLYAGASHSCSPTAGEVIIVLGGPSPSEVRAGLDRMIATIESGPAFRHADDAGTIAFLAHVVSSCGSYLSELAGGPAGRPLAYLIAPPLEAMYGLDAALKAAEVELARFISPPSETNYGGAVLAGDEASCRAACDAFSKGVLGVAQQPVYL
ncbi:ethanolamine utilization microcompartment protein EutL [Noviherbaspirillum saxi]|uniref:Ethanolamine utilization microcompartment protein EutL n=1 Tax=Noviherbaspirillum saxi TaxID=2320863 RepID=A0A3A3FG39_9BURK|nr:ethanolamine utilization microcompartment protein EutL [Noviherbaspirillum saxi]RJF92057.1 ethanolamine utilization microcompartment protein EutL [Noviherbaspirillum saxi]